MTTSTTSLFGRLKEGYARYVWAAKKPRLSKYEACKGLKPPRGYYLLPISCDHFLMITRDGERLPALLDVSTSAAALPPPGPYPRRPQGLTR